MLCGARQEIEEGFDSGIANFGYRDKKCLHTLIAMQTTPNSKSIHVFVWERPTMDCRLSRFQLACERLGLSSTQAFKSMRTEEQKRMATQTWSSSAEVGVGEGLTTGCFWIRGALKNWRSSEKPLEELATELFGAWGNAVRSLRIARGGMLKCAAGRDLNLALDGRLGSVYCCRQPALGDGRTELN